MPRDYSHYMSAAQAALDAGFPNKVRRKEAMEAAGRAYEEVRREHNTELLKVPHEDRDEAWHERYDLPFQLNHWRPKHAPLVEPADLERIEAAVALRAAIAAAPEIAKAPRPKTAAELAWEAEAMECQVCARAICAKTGKIAHHGYARPGGGWQTASCYGAKHLPWEVSRDALGKLIEALEARLLRELANRADVDAERVAMPWSWKVRVQVEGQPIWRKVEEPRSAMVSRSGWDAMLAASPDNAAMFSRVNGLGTFDAAKARRLASLDSSIAMLRSDIAAFKARYASWKQTHQRAGKAWIALEV